MGIDEISSFVVSKCREYITEPFLHMSRQLISVIIVSFEIVSVSNYVSGGELLSLCQQYGPLPEELAAIYIAEIALALGKILCCKSI